MTKRDILHKFFDYRTRSGRGNYWLGMIEEYLFPVSRIMDWVFTYISLKMAISGSSIGWIITGALFFYGYKLVLELLRLGLTKLDHKYYIQQMEIDWSAKNTKYNIFTIQQMETEKEKIKVLNAIAEKLGIEDRAVSKFTEL